MFSVHPISAAPCTGSDIQGVVFNDYNADGRRSVGNTEPGIFGLVVTAFSGDGSSTTCESLVDGSFGIDAPSGGFPVRVEITRPPGFLWDALEPGASGLTSVFFASAPTTGIEVGFNAPGDYCQPNPDVMTTCFLQGSPLVSGSAAALGDTVISVDYDRTVPNASHLALGSQVGNVWGLAYQRSSESLYASAILRRHAGFGPLGIGGIYRLDYSSGGPPVVSPFVDAAAIGIPVGVDPRTQPGEDPPGNGPTGNEPGLDNLTYEQIGKVGLGDLDIEEDAGRLWVMSLGDGTLYGMDIGPAGDVPSSATAFPLPAVSCTDGVFRPWAVKSYRGRIYIGGVCSNESISPYPAPVGFIDFPNLVGYVYSMDPAEGVFSLEMTVPLNYVKGCAAPAVGCQWYPWTDLSTASVVASPTLPSHPTPILSDIEFADDGDMLIGLADRTGLQYGVFSPLPNSTPTDITVLSSFLGGDMLRADFDPASGGWTLESNGIVGGLAGAGSGNNEGPGGGEYYSASTAGVHFELSQGGFAVLPGSGHFVGSAMDPLTINSGGLLWMQDKGAAPGSKFAGYTLYVGGLPPTFNKGASVGDVELRCDEAPIEIGNRVWCDGLAADLPNGIQDPVGAGVPDFTWSGITVDLDCDNGAVTASTTTDAEGRYLFSDANVAGGIPPLTPCTVSIDTGSPGNSAIMGACRRPTLLQSGSAGDLGLDLRDSDGVDLGGGVIGAVITTGGPGANDHSVDFGFIEPTGADISITKTDGVTAATPGGTVTYSLVVANGGPAADPAVQVSDAFPASLDCSYTSTATGGATGNGAGTGDIMEILSMPAGSSVTYSAVCGVDAAATGTLSNTATATGSLIDPTPGNESDSDSDTVLVPEADLTVTKSDSSDPIAFGETLIYTIDVTNVGPSQATSVTVIDRLPSAVSFIRAEGTGWSCHETEAVVTCDLASLNPGAASPITIEVTAPAENTVLTNVVDVGSTVADPTLGNNTWTENTAVLGSPVEIPTARSAGLLLLAALLTGAAVFTLRRRP